MLFLYKFNNSFVDKGFGKILKSSSKQIRKIFVFKSM